MKLLLKAPGWSYEITEDDILWMARAATGEGDPAHVIWCWMQRFASGNNNGIGNFRQTANFPTLKDMVTAHSQPVNPKWRRDGEFCRPGGRYAGGPRCAPNLLDRRDYMASVSWEQMPAAVRGAIDALRSANLPNPVPRAVDFADESVANGYVSRNAATNGATISFVGPSGNRFITTTKSRGWPDNYISVEASGSCKAILIGDSHSVRLKAPLEATLRTRGYNLAATFAEGGWGTRRMVSDHGTAIRQAVATHQPQVVIVELGANDNPDARIAGDMRALIDIVGAPRVLWIGPPRTTRDDVHARHLGVITIQRQVAAETGIVWLDGKEMTATAAQMPDGVHFNTAGSQQWAQSIVSTLRPCNTVTKEFTIASLFLGPLGTWVTP
jgi:lysophospholipase L1-like esterase